MGKSAQGKGLYKINVAKEDLSAAVQLLQEYQLPSQERLEIAQLFPANALVNSPQIEKARLISGIEQRLEQSLMAQIKLQMCVSTLVTLLLVIAVVKRR
ncbi:MAG TPA: hypothetical protein ACHBX0_04710 [Arsenophonus sp.]